MASIFAKKLMGESTTTGDVAPVMTGAPVISNPSATAAKRRIPTASPDKLKKARNRVVDGLMGIREDRDGAVIPSDAKEVQTIEQNDHGLNLDSPKIPGQKIRNPYSGEEPLILPAASLVAPDVTPEGIFPLDPSQLPGSDQGHAPRAPQMSAPQAPAAGSPAIDVVLGKTPDPAAAGFPASNPGQPSAPAAATSLSTESALSYMPGIPSPAAAAAASISAPSPEALVASGQPMPDHTSSGDIRGIMETFSQFIPRSSMKLRE